MIVLKFGGSILDGPDGVRTLARVVASTTGPRVVVVSAFAQVTNRLEEIALLATTDRSVAQDESARLFDDHESIAGSLFVDESLRDWRDIVRPWRVRLDEIIEGLSLTAELTPRTLDLVVSFGERLSSSLVLPILREIATVHHVPATALFVTNDRHRFALLQTGATGDNVDRLIRPFFATTAKDVHDRLLVTEGYVGRTFGGEVSTMGRESSDFSAAFLGAALEAREVCLYTGVPGVMSADPAQVTGVRTIDRLDYRSAREIARLGAKVLHPRTLRPVEEAQIPLVITNVAGERTVIGPDLAPEATVMPMIVDASRLQITLQRVDCPVDEIHATVLRRSDVLRTTRSGRRLDVFVRGPVAHSVIDTLLGLGQVESAAVDAVSLLSLVCGTAIDPERIGAFLALMRRDEIDGLWSDPEERSISVILVGFDPEAVLRRVHEQFLGR